MSEKIYNVLFLCTGNSARSIMAECILNRHSTSSSTVSDRATVAAKFRAFSAGSKPSGNLDPTVKALLKQTNYPTEGLRSKSWDEFAKPGAPEMDFVFTVCDSAAGEICPVWPGQPMTAHWGVPDPSAFVGSDTEKAAFCADVMRMLFNRISIFTALPIASLDRLALQSRLDSIGQT